MTLGDQGFRLRMSGSDPPEGYRIRVTITRVYCRSILASLRASIVLSTEYYRDGVLLGKRVHMGEGVVEDSSPLSGTYRFNERRVLQSLNIGLADAVAQVADTIRELEGQ